MRHDSVVPRFIVFAALLALGTRSASAFDIAKDGKAAAVIVVGENPTATTVTAANELASYLSGITGAKFTIAAKPEEGRNTILVGTPYPNGQPEEFCIRVKDATTLERTGEGTRGTLYAVYACLERFGVRFWAPDSETVPRTKDLSVPQGLSVVSAPAFGGGTR